MPKSIARIAGTRVPTTTVGSISPNISMEEYLQAQASANINYPTTGQYVINEYLGNMGGPFFTAFEGVLLTDKPRGKGITSLEILVDADEFQVGKEESITTLPIVREVQQAHSMLEQIKSNGMYPAFKGLKACVTGPYTLRRSAILKGKGKTEEEIFQIINMGLVEILKQMVAMGAQAIQIDEPFLTLTNSMPSDLALQAIGDLFQLIQSSGLHSKVQFVALHACGVILPDLFTELVRMPNLDVLDLEFAEHKEENFKIVSSQRLTAAQLNIAIGVVTKREEHMETLTETANLVNEIRRRSFELEFVMLKPDCGLRKIGDVEKALAKVRLVEEARKMLLK